MTEKEKLIATIDASMQVFCIVLWVANAGHRRLWNLRCPANYCDCPAELLPGARGPGAVERTEEVMKTMTLEQHRQFGQQVQQFRATLMQRHIICADKKSSRAYRTLMSALKYVERLQSDYDSIVCRDFRECKDATGIYYGWGADKLRL